MGALFVYILKSSVCLILFYLCYRWMLSRETFHRFNRFALLGVWLLSLTIPLYKATTDQPLVVHEPMMELEELFSPELPHISYVEYERVDHSQRVLTWTWQEVTLIVYLLGLFFFFFRTFYSLVRIAFLLRKSRIKRVGRGLRLVIHNCNIVSFSWMGFIVMSSLDLKEGGREILVHEREHIRHYHFLDLMLAELLILFQWFNPTAWLFKKELQSIHEYEADEAVLRHGINAKKYQLLLIKKMVGPMRFNSLANNFNHSTLKKRITMMLKKKSNPWGRLKYLYVLPLVAAAVVVFARPEVSGELDRISSLNVNDLAEKLESNIKKVEPITAEQSKKVKDRTEPVEVLDDQGARSLPFNKLMAEGKCYKVYIDGLVASSADIINIPAKDIAEISLMNMKPELMEYCGGKDGTLFVDTKQYKQKEKEVEESLSAIDKEYKLLYSRKFESSSKHKEEVKAFLASANVDLSNIRIVVDGELVFEEYFDKVRERRFTEMQVAANNKGERILYVRTSLGDSFRQFKAMVNNPLVIINGKETTIDKIKPSDIHNEVSFQMYGADHAEQFGPKAREGALFIGVQSQNYYTEEWKEVIKNF